MGTGSGSSTSPTTSKSPPRSPTRPPSKGAASNPVLRPLPETAWIAQSRKSPIHSHAPFMVPQPRESSLGALHDGLPSSPLPTADPHPQQTQIYPPALSPPPPDPLRGIGDELIYQKSATWSEEKEKILLGPYDYLYGHPGKDIRAQLIAAFNAWLKVPEESLGVITRVVGMLHTASLLVDDVEDSSLLRRGVPVANSIFGTAQTINSANYVYFLALKELSKLRSPQAIDIYTEELLNLHRGQGMDLFWRDTLTCPSEADYLEMVSNKTGGLFRLAVKLMQAESASDIDCVPLVNTTGLLFQILDDHLNLLSPTYTALKTFAEDLTEGKFSFPIIHAIRADPSNLVLINILRQKTKDEQVKRYAVDYMGRMGSFEYSRRVIRQLRRKALGLVEELEGRVEGGREGGEGIRRILERMRVE
ncbi:geranylgeranyl pyrophosphate synthetase [Coniosporium apollinis]|uniref:Geranylgeranyl pyrophosphate synthetase n=2 Tax=Coniosporium TaxID=2810619 RepID=A0ABQ9NL48_9PEZI|nr:geranylgeranyl pyrophosphate synthetase [Cladosporium sp. JES 115]KAJ9660739.1 geranylgeranyl pyrophosphate synthetase [Coniosporium apollinis]